PGSTPQSHAEPDDQQPRKQDLQAIPSSTSSGCSDQRERVPRGHNERDHPPASTQVTSPGE
ncbi:hypothetical protein, partial [Frankia nepalensis]|uniref:hypothetical protein n=1 Tax=Frankia nepalensis TaxID=1836974 RepID=UPI001EE3D9A0